jgi:hypothetical protein
MKPIVTYGQIAPFNEPTLGRGVYVLDVHNHPAGLEGELVITSPIVSMTHVDGVLVEFETLNTIYRPRNLA